MSLEAEIKLLREEVSGLRDFLATLVTERTPTPENPLVPDLKTEYVEPVEVEPAPPKKPAEPEPVEVVEDDAPAPTMEELQSLCMSIVRADRSKKNQIYEVIASFGGKTVGQVDSSKYAELGVALEALR